jgi:hypothetical protein
MSGCNLGSLVPSGDQVYAFLSAAGYVTSIIGSVVIAASLVTSWTTTPTPGTRRAAAYRYLERAALLFGRAKDTGVLPPTPRLDAELKRAIDLVRGQKR